MSGVNLRWFSSPFGDSVTFLGHWTVQDSNILCIHILWETYLSKKKYFVRNMSYLVSMACHHKSFACLNTTLLHSLLFYLPVRALLFLYLGWSNHNKSTFIFSDKWSFSIWLDPLLFAWIMKSFLWLNRCSVFNLFRLWLYL